MFIISENLCNASRFISWRKAEIHHGSRKKV